MRSEIHNKQNERHKPFHHACQFACSFLGVAPRQQDDNLSMAGPEPVHGEVHLVAHPVGSDTGLVMPVRLVSNGRLHRGRDNAH